MNVSVFNYSLHNFTDCHRSTETAVLKVLSDILSVLVSGNLAMLTLLDMSAAVNSVDHYTLVQRLRRSYTVGRKGRRLVCVVPQRPSPISSHYDVQFDAIGSFVRSTTRLGARTDLVASLHCRPPAAG